MLLEDLKMYKVAMDVGEQTWEIVMQWEYFSKITIGKQLIASVDSIAANISEGFGRFHFKDSKKFYYYARGSLLESRTWFQKAYSRKLISEENYKELVLQLDQTHAMLNSFIQKTGKKIIPGN